MYLRKRRSSSSGKAEDVEPQLVELLADRLLVEDTDDGILAVHARHDRDAEVDALAAHPHLEAAVLRHALLGDVELRHDLHARDDRAVEALVDRPHRRLQDAVDPVLHVHRIVLRLDVDVARAALDRRIERRVDQPDDRALVRGQLVDGQLVVELVLAQDLQLKTLGRLFEDALRALALLQDRLNRRRRADGDLDRRRQQHRQLVDHRQVGRIRHDDDERCALAAVGNEAVPQHQVRGNRAEQLVIDAELRQVDERQPVALGQPARVRRLGRLLGGGGFRDADVQVVGPFRRRCRALTVHGRLSVRPFARGPGLPTKADR